MRLFLFFFLAVDSSVLRAEDPVDPPAPLAAPSTSATTTDLGALGLGTITATARRGDTLYVALAEGGVAVVDVADPAAPRLVDRLLPGRAVSRLVIDGDRLIALVLSEEAVAFSLADPRAPTLALPALPFAPAATVAAPTSPTPPATAPSPTTTPTTATRPSPAKGRVLEVTGGRVVFDGGSGAGFSLGQRVKVIAQRLVDKPDLKTGGTKKSPSNEVTAVVAIEEVDADRAMAKLGRGDTAAAGDLVEVTEEPLSERLFLPPRAPLSLRTGFHVRPFFGLAQNGFPVGALVDAYAWWMPSEDVPVAVTAGLSPAGGAIFGVTPHYPVTIAVGATYVTDWFEVGLGGGGLVGNEGPCTFPAASTPVEPGEIPELGEAVCETNTGFTFNQFLRLGAQDGIHLAWESSIFARPEGFVLGTGRGELAVPVSSRVGLYGAGGVGENGWAFGEIGVRSMFGGTGGAGTTILSASLGGAGVFDGPGERVDSPDGFDFFQQETVAGPSVGFGVEWRL